MKPTELFRRAVDEIGDIPAAELSEHLERKHGVKIEPAFIPLFRAWVLETSPNRMPTSQYCRTEPDIDLDSSISSM